jgi:hypothetical protein
MDDLRVDAVLSCPTAERLAIHGGSRITGQSNCWEATDAHRFLADRRTQLSKSAVSPASKPAGRMCGNRVSKPAIQQIWKSALRLNRFALLQMERREPLNAACHHTHSPLSVKHLSASVASTESERLHGISDPTAWLWRRIFRNRDGDHVDN